MRPAAALLLALLTGCTVSQQKGEAYKEAAAKFGYPEKLRVCYSREGNTQSGSEYRCFGEGCELPDCPRN